MNILKPAELLDKSEYQKLYYHFNFDEILRKVFSGIKKYRFFSIYYEDEDHIIFEPNNDFFQLSNVSNLAKLLEKEANSFLLIMNERKKFNIRHKKKILFYLHMDWILALQHLKDVDGDNREIIEYLQFETGNKDISKKINHINGSSGIRSNIYTVNRDSVIVNLIDKKKCNNTTKLTNENYDLILKNNLISFIEISKGFDNSKLTPFLRLMNGYCENILNKNTVTEEMKFSLKIRKIKRTNKKGMYIVNQNSILLDPRHVDSFLHELGHWYHNWFHKEIKLKKDAENFANKFVEENI